MCSGWSKRPPRCIWFPGANGHGRRRFRLGCDLDAPCTPGVGEAIASVESNESNLAKSFGAALDFEGGGDHGPRALQLTTTEPLNAQHLTKPSPAIRASLAAAQQIDVNSLEMWVSGLGRVAAQYDAKSKRVSYALTQRLVPNTYTVIVSAKVKGQNVAARWTFTVDGA